MFIAAPPLKNKFTWLKNFHLPSKKFDPKLEADGKTCTVLSPISTHPHNPWNECAGKRATGSGDQPSG